MGLASLPLAALLLAMTAQFIADRLNLFAKLWTVLNGAGNGGADELNRLHLVVASSCLHNLRQTSSNQEYEDIQVKDQNAFQSIDPILQGAAEVTAAPYHIFLVVKELA